MACRFNSIKRASHLGKIHENQCTRQKTTRIGQIPPSHFIFPSSTRVTLLYKMDIPPQHDASKTPQKQNPPLHHFKISIIFQAEAVPSTLYLTMAKKNENINSTLRVPITKSYI